jgi:4-hydroxymandelate oxidase
VFVASPPAGTPLRHDLHLVRAGRRSFTGSAEFLADADNRARVGEYLADMGRPYGREVPATPFGEPASPDLGHSYGEMAAALIGSVVPADEPVDLLVLAFSVHDLRPGRQTAAYLSHVTPGEPMAFAVCDQGSAAAFSGLRMIREYAASAAITRALLVVVEQAALPYDSPATLPLQHQAVAMLYCSELASDQPVGAGLGGDSAIQPVRVAGVRQHPGVPPGDVAVLAAADLAGLAAADLAGLAAGHQDVALVLSDALAAVWTAPAASRVRVMPPGQPSTDVWWGLIGELTGDAGPDAPASLLVAADYDPQLRYLCLTAFGTGTLSR